MQGIPAPHTLQMQQQQHQQQQQTQHQGPGVPTTSEVTHIASTRPPPSSNVAVLTTTDGYVSFSESDPDSVPASVPGSARGSEPESAFRVDVTTRVRIGKPVVSGKDSGCHSPDIAGCGEPFTTYGKTVSSGQKPHDQSNDGDGDSDKWDFGDDNTEEEHEHDVKQVGGKAQANSGRALVGGERYAAPGGTTRVCGGSGVPEEPQVHITVDKLGRWKNAPRR